MGLLERLRGGVATEHPQRGSLADDAGAVRATLDGLQRETGGRRLSLRGVLRDLLEGEVAAPTADVGALRDSGVDPDAFYAREIAPSWDGLGEAQRAARLEGFLEMCSMIEGAGDLGAIPADMAATVRTKTLLIAWAFDDEYGYLPRLARGEAVAT
jgi:hypothetical protein